MTNNKDLPKGSDKRDFSDLKALFINCTLKPAAQMSHTDGLIMKSAAIMTKSGVTVEKIRASDFEIAPGVYHDMTEHGFEKDQWPEIYDKVMNADILVLGTPIWLGAKSSICSRVIERLYAESGNTNELGQYIYYGKVGGCIITGNEDGIKHCAMNMLYSMQHLGYTIPPQADAGWIGEAGPGPSYLDEGSGGEENEFTQRNTTFMTWNLMHLASILKQLGGIPAYGNVKTDWDDGERFDYPNPEYR
ncbi:MAG: flavodoxin family protein [Pyrinomonadaceae bacterium]|nr:flavodoxin family protein [Pyrinomonadaceae bacterium]